MPRNMKLTEREQQVLGLFALGKGVPEIAKVLKISQNRVRELKKQLCAKLGILPSSNIIEVVKAGRDKGYVGH